MLPYDAQQRSVTRRFFDEGDQHEADQEWELDVANTNAAEDPERRFSSFDRVPKRHGPRRIAAAVFLLVGAGFLWHYRQGVREVVLTRVFHEPPGSDERTAEEAAASNGVARPAEVRATIPATPPATGAPPAAVVQQDDRPQPSTSSPERSGTFDRGLQPIPPPEVTAPIPATPAAPAAVPGSGHVQPASKPAVDSSNRAAGVAASGPTSNREVASGGRRSSRQGALEPSSATSGARAKRGYVWSPSADALVPATEAVPTSLPASAGSSPSASQDVAAPANGQRGVRPDDTLAPSLDEAAAAAGPGAPKEAPPAASERQPEQPAPKTIASPSLGSPPVIAPPRAAPEPDERPVTPTEPPPFK